MQPIFSEMIKMWGDLGYELPIKEGIYWLDNNFIKAFTRDGVLHKLYKYKVFDDLSIEITPYTKNKMVLLEKDFETWEDTIRRNEDRMTQLENDSIKLIKEVFEKYSDYDKYILNSTGKDSMVTLDLIHRVNSSVPVVFNNTSLDCADTYKMVKRHKDWIVTNPKEGFYQWIRRVNYIPTRFSRGCCTMYKERDIIEIFRKQKKMLYFMGVRNDESVKRKEREDINHNPKWGIKREWYNVMPIRKFSDLDVWLYIIKYKLETNPKYRKGYNRVGCSIACPYYTKYTWVLDNYWYPKARKRWENILKNDFLSESRWTRLNCTLKEYLQKGWAGGVYRPEPTEEVIEEFMEHKNITDRNLALQYFNKTCCECGKNVKQNDVLAMNLKLFNKNIDKFYCQKCLMKKLNISDEQWADNVKRFKEQNCTLF